MQTEWSSSEKEHQSKNSKIENFLSTNVLQMEYSKPGLWEGTVKYCVKLPSGISIICTEKIGGYQLPDWILVFSSFKNRVGRQQRVEMGDTLLICHKADYHVGCKWHWFEFSLTLGYELRAEMALRSVAAQLLKASRYQPREQVSGQRSVLALAGPSSGSSLSLQSQWSPGVLKAVISSSSIEP